MSFGSFYSDPGHQVLSIITNGHAIKVLYLLQHPLLHHISSFGPVRLGTVKQFVTTDLKCIFQNWGFPEVNSPKRLLYLCSVKQREAIDTSNMAIAFLTAQTIAGTCFSFSLSLFQNEMWARSKLTKWNGKNWQCCI